MQNCPRCGFLTKKVQDTFICECGWTYSKQNEASQGSIIAGMFLSFTLVALGLFHFFQWGSHGFSIIFANSADKVEICMDLKKYDCVEKNYKTLYDQTGDLKFLEELGEIQFKRDKFKSAKKTYTLYFSKKGRSSKSAYYYAHSLSQSGELDLAIKYFDSILKSKPKVLMVTVLESYLEVLVSNNRITKAKEVLSFVNHSNKGAVNTANQIATWRKKFNI